MPRLDPEAYLHFCSKILSDQKDECALRTSINRYYYACHLMGREAVVKKGWYKLKFNAEDHAGVWRELEAKKNPTGVGRKLSELYRMREHADYHTDTDLAENSYCKYCNDDYLPKKINADAKEVADNIFPKLKSLASVKASDQ